MLSIAFLLIVLETGCANNRNGGEDFSSKDNLERRIAQYYECEKYEEWGKSYKFRTPGYQKAIALENYVSTMTADNSGWKLISYEVKNIAIQSGSAKIKIKFIESVPKEFSKSINVELNVNEVSFSETTEWVLIDNTWYAKSVGIRGRLRMNALLVP